MLADRSLMLLGCAGVFSLAVATAAARQPGESAVTTVEFSGYKWLIKESAQRVGPGPNYFAASNVWVDSNGFLHLKISRSGSMWLCSEVINTLTLGFGTYEWKIRESAALDGEPMSVLGMFTWDSTSQDAKAQAYREIDIEVARWGDPSAPNGQFVVQPYNLPDRVTRFNLPAGPVVHRFTWQPDRVFFESVDASRPVAADTLRTVIHSHTFHDGIPTPGLANARVNLWLLGGIAAADWQQIEIVIEYFRHTPLR